MCPSGKYERTKEHEIKRMTTLTNGNLKKINILKDEIEEEKRVEQARKELREVSIKTKPSRYPVCGENYNTEPGISIGGKKAVTIPIGEAKEFSGEPSSDEYAGFIQRNIKLK